MIQRMDERAALEQVSGSYGSVEEFALVVIEEAPEFLDGVRGQSVMKLAAQLKLPAGVVGRVLNSVPFQNALDQAAALSTYNYQKRVENMRQLASVAAAGKRLTTTTKGDVVEVDVDPSWNIRADEHLRKLQGRPLDSRGGSAMPTIQIHFEGASEGSVSIEQTTSEGAQRVYAANRAGALPPEGSRAYYNYEGSQNALEPSARFGLDAPEFDFRSESVEGERQTITLDEATDVRTLGRGDGREPVEQFRDAVGKARAKRWGET